MPENVKNKFFLSEHGASIVEYVVMIAIFVLVTVTAAAMAGDEGYNTFWTTARHLADALDSVGKTKATDVTTPP